MEILFGFVAGGLVEIGKRLCGCICPHVTTIFTSQSNLDILRLEMKELINLKNRVEAQIEAAKGEGYVLSTAVIQWLKQVDDEEKEVESLTANSEALHKCYPSCCCLRSRPDLKLEVTKVRNLLHAGNFPPVHEGIKKVEHMDGPLIEDQSTASRNLSKVLELLKSEEVGTIGVWGMAGVGKTTLVQNLNDHLKTDSSYDIVLWVTVSNSSDLTVIQRRIAERLKLEVKAEESRTGTAARIKEKLQVYRYLLILDDVWEAIDVDSLGIPPREHHSGGKVLITSRFLNVCRHMMTNENVEVEVLNEEESWKLFAKFAKLTTPDPEIEPHAREVVRECDGLPLAIILVGASMRGKRMFEQWKHALSTLQSPLMTDDDGMRNKVYNHIKHSYDALRSSDIKSCFLCCSLYPEDSNVVVTELVQSWLAEVGLTDDQKYEDSFNRGIALVENLKDSCLLEHGKGEGRVKMHDVVRDFAIWIASSEGCKSAVHSGIGLSNISQVGFSDSVKRFSFMYNDITQLPNAFTQCSEASTLLLQENCKLEIVPEGFLPSFRALSVLNLANTSIQSLPPLSQLGELRALNVGRCHYLKELPPLRGLSKLQFLDCSFTSLTELPEGMQELTNLRLLNLGYTRHLKSIRQGIISQLRSLEVLEMEASSYIWELATIDELEYLYRISVCPWIVMDTSCLASKSLPSLVERLKMFRFWIGRDISLKPSYNISHTQTVVHLFKISLSGRQFGWLLNNVSALVLNNCKELEKLPASLGRNRCFSELRSLAINGYKGRFPSGGAEFSRMPNLEELHLDSVDSLESLSNLDYIIEFDFSKLKKLTVYSCCSLRYLLSAGDSTLTMKNLELATVRDCEKLEELFIYDSSSQTPIIPVPRELRLYGLPELHTLCGQHESWQRLEKLEVERCPRINKLPLNTECAKTIKEIKGTREWWSQLEWDEEDTKSSLEQHLSYLFDGRASLLVGEQDLWNWERTS